MKIRSKTKNTLATLLPVGILGISTALASVHSEPNSQKLGIAYPNATTDRTAKVDQRLREIRAAVSAISAEARKDQPGSADSLVAVWLNGGFGWRNGGWGNGGNWGNGGFRNGGWGNGWHNAPNWGNGGNGWHNAPNWGNGGWHNFWHNW